MTKQARQEDIIFVQHKNKNKKTACSEFFIQKNVMVAATRKGQTYTDSERRLKRRTRGAQNAHKAHGFNRQIVARAVVRLRLVRVGQHLSVRARARVRVSE
jgi:hypothetical protein